MPTQRAKAAKDELEYGGILICTTRCEWDLRSSEAADDSTLGCGVAAKKKTTQLQISEIASREIASREIASREGCWPLDRVQGRKCKIPKRTWADPPSSVAA
jgi:hypothetical protein